jgi:hypothetical protein
MMIEICPTSGEVGSRPQGGEALSRYKRAAKKWLSQMEGFPSFKDRRFMAFYPSHTHGTCALWADLWLTGTSDYATVPGQEPVDPFVKMKTEKEAFEKAGRLRCEPAFERKTSYDRDTLQTEVWCELDGEKEGTSLFYITDSKGGKHVILMRAFRDGLHYGPVMKWDEAGEVKEQGW